LNVVPVVFLISLNAAQILCYIKFSIILSLLNQVTLSTKDPFLGLPASGLLVVNLVNEDLQAAVLPLIQM